MTNHVRNRASHRAVLLILTALLVLGSLTVMISTVEVVELGVADSATGLNEAESAYYEYVAPRLDRLVTEVDDVVVMVEGKSRDILALTISGSRIEDLASEITSYGVAHGVPGRFQNVHATIKRSTDTATFTFDQARESLRTFDFSRMSGLVTDFQDAASGLHTAQAEMETIAGGTKDAYLPRVMIFPAHS